MTYRQFFSLAPRSLQHLMILLLPLSFMASAEDASFEEGMQYQEARKIVVLDDGSTGSRVVSFLFGRNYNHEEFRLIKQSPMHEASSLSLKHGGITDKSAQLIANLLKEENCGVNCKSSFFLGATAGKRTDKENAKKVFGEIRKKLEHFGVDGSKYDIEMKVLDGSMEGAYNWLGVNYIYGKLDNPEESYGIVELGGSSTQVAVSLKSEIDTDNIKLFNKSFSLEKIDDKALLFFEHGLIQKNVNKVMAESKLGFGLKKAYKNYKEKFKNDSPCEGWSKGRFETANYFECQQAMDSLFPKEDDDKYGKRVFWRSGDRVYSWEMPDTYYLSGYFYDYTVHMGLRSHLTLWQFEMAAYYSCEHHSLSYLDLMLNRNEMDDGVNLFSFFEKSLSQPVVPRVVTKASDFKYSGSIQNIERDKNCGTLTYMVSLLKHFGIQRYHNLVIVKSFVQNGKPHPATWTPGYAYAKANDYEIKNKITINTLHQDKKVADQDVPEAATLNPSGIIINKPIEEDISYYMQP
ncbi:hypothetical protein [Endozoicomonas lisbonensis]